MKGKYLITTNNWFIAPDGKTYRAVWGEVVIVEDTILGVKTNRNSVNWYAKIGSDEKHAIIAGCQINYAIRCEKQPENKCSENYSWNEKEAAIFSELPPVIYIAE